PIPRGAVQRGLDRVVAAGVPGALILVRRGDDSVALAAGVANTANGRPLLADAHFRIGSVTKSFVATVVLQLAGEGRLSLDDSVEHWLPDLVPDGDAITLRELLNHTSGLFDYFEDPTFFGALVADPTAPWTPQQLVAVGTSHPLLF